MTMAGAAHFFDAVAQEYASWYAARTPGGHALRERQRRVLELLPAPCTVLDVGCGPGVLAGELLGRGYDVWGVDAAPGMIEQCWRRFGTLGRQRFAVADATRYDLPDASFDAVVCTGVIDRLPDGAAAVREMARVLRPGGTLVIAFPNRLSPYAAWKNYLYYPALALLRPLLARVAGRPAGPALPSSLATMYTVGSARALLARAGLRCRAVDAYYFNPFLSPLDEWLPAAGLWLVERFEPYHRSILRTLGAGLLLQAERLA